MAYYYGEEGESSSMVDWCSAPTEKEVQRMLLLAPASSTAAANAQKRTASAVVGMDQHATTTAPKHRNTLMDNYQPQQQQEQFLSGGVAGSWHATTSSEDAWLEKFQLLWEFRQKHGHCRVPLGLEIQSVKLGRWVANQRVQFKKFTEGGRQGVAFITQERIEQLNSLGFEWNYDEAWNQKFELLCTFQRANGHCRVPYNFEVDSVKLGQWVNTQRSYYKNLIKGQGQAYITQDRIDQLNSIGFEWRLQQVDKGAAAWNQNYGLLQESPAQKTRDTAYREEAWNQKFKLLCTFQRVNGHCCVPQNFKVDSVKLGQWVSKQREYYKNFLKGRGQGKITQVRIAKLNSIGFDWEGRGIGGSRSFDEATDNETWNQMFDLLQEYFRNNKHCRVPSNYEVDSVKLGQWAAWQRECFKYFTKGQQDERIDQLNLLGFEWDFGSTRPEDTEDTDWNHMFEALHAFYCKNGHCRVPYSLDVESARLSHWMKDQRRHYSNFMDGQGQTSMTQDRIDKLNSLGFEWSSRRRSSRDS